MRGCRVPAQAGVLERYRYGSSLERLAGDLGPQRLSRDLVDSDSVGRQRCSRDVCDVLRRAAAAVARAYRSYRHGDPDVARIDPVQTRRESDTDEERELPSYGVE